MNCDQCILVGQTELLSLRWKIRRCVNVVRCTAFQISGESGSGKTEAAKLTLQYLAAVTSHHRECHAVKYQILQSNPVLEGESTPYLYRYYNWCIFRLNLGFYPGFFPFSVKKFSTLILLKHPF